VVEPVETPVVTCGDFDTSTGSVESTSTGSVESTSTGSVESTSTGSVESTSTGSAGSKLNYWKPAAARVPFPGGRPRRDPAAVFNDNRTHEFSLLSSLTDTLTRHQITEFRTCPKSVASHRWRRSTPPWPGSTRWRWTTRSTPGYANGPGNTPGRIGRWSPWMGKRSAGPKNGRSGRVFLMAALDPCHRDGDRTGIHRGENQRDPPFPGP
jgi:hypothetical protein